jgi:hypothetical protein
MDKTASFSETEEPENLSHFRCSTGKQHFIIGNSKILFAGDCFNSLEY